MAGTGQSWQKDAADQNFDYMFKLLIIGNSSVGKTSFLFRYADDSFTSAFVSTVGIDFKVKTVFRQDKRVKLQIWVSLTRKEWGQKLIGRFSAKKSQLGENPQMPPDFLSQSLLDFGQIIATSKTHSLFYTRGCDLIE